MNNAELYNKSNSLQKRDALQCLDEYVNKTKWEHFGDEVIDIGCGDGSVTSMLKKYLPHNFKKLVGCDISEKMVNFANDHHGDNRTTFKVLDIEGDLPKELKGKFSHAFSFYTLHWIRHQEYAFTNIYDMLAENGDCLLVFLGHTPIFDVYRILARRNKWSSWLKDVDRYISPYHDSQDPNKEIRTMMEKIGFNKIEVKCKEMAFVYDDLNVLKKSVAAINPFKIPLDIFEDFMDDYLEVVKGMRLMDKVSNNRTETINIKFTYSLLVVSACKSPPLI